MTDEKMDPVVTTFLDKVAKSKKDSEERDAEEKSRKLRDEELKTALEGRAEPEFSEICDKLELWSKQINGHSDQSEIIVPNRSKYHLSLTRQGCTVSVQFKHRALSGLGKEPCIELQITGAQNSAVQLEPEMNSAKVAWVDNRLGHTQNYGDSTDVAEMLLEALRTHGYSGLKQKGR